MEPVVFTWDSAKARVNLAKHGIAFEDAFEAFRDPLARIFPDVDHSDAEVREILVAFTPPGRLLVVSLRKGSGSFA